MGLCVCNIHLSLLTYIALLDVVNWFNLPRCITVLFAQHIFGLESTGKTEAEKIIQFSVNISKESNC